MRLRTTLPRRGAILFSRGFLAVEIEAVGQVLVLSGTAQEWGVFALVMLAAVVLAKLATVVLVM